jgi:hypothetical protein
VNQTVEISGRQFRIFLANWAIALGWALRSSCKACAHRLFASGRWLVPEAQRLLIRHTGSHNQHRHLLNFAPDLVTLLHRIQPLRVAAGLLIVLVLLGSLDLATRATVRKFSELAQEDILKPIPVSGTQTEAVPLPTRKPQVAYKSPKKKVANATTQKKLAQRKNAKR